MKTLYLLRHATPVNGVPGQGDEERPLSHKGLEETANVGRRLASSPGSSPVDVILCSSARRTVETLEGLREALSPDVALFQEDQLYCASQGELLDRIGQAGDDCDGILVIGHNPGIAMLAATLARSGDPELLARVGSMYPPAALAIIDFDVERWSDVTEFGGTLVAF